jgi:hypothetical protein
MGRQGFYMGLRFLGVGQCMECSFKPTQGTRVVRLQDKHLLIGLACSLGHRASAAAQKSPQF